MCGKWGGKPAQDLSRSTKQAALSLSQNLQFNSWLKLHWKTNVRTKSSINLTGRVPQDRMAYHSQDFIRAVDPSCGLVSEWVWYSSTISKLWLFWLWRGNLGLHGFALGGVSMHANSLQDRKGPVIATTTRKWCDCKVATISCNGTGDWAFVSQRSNFKVLICFVWFYEFVWTSCI